MPLGWGCPPNTFLPGDFLASGGGALGRQVTWLPAELTQGSTSFSLTLCPPQGSTCGKGILLTLTYGRF